MKRDNIFRGDHRITVIVHPDMLLRIRNALISEGLFERVTLKASRFIKGERVVYVISNDDSRDRIKIEGEPDVHDD